MNLELSCQLRTLAEQLLLSPARARLVLPDGSINRAALRAEIERRLFAVDAAGQMGRASAPVYHNHRGYSDRKRQPKAGKRSGTHPTR